MSKGINLLEQVTPVMLEIRRNRVGDSELDAMAALLEVWGHYQSELTPAQICRIGAWFNSVAADGD